MRGAVWGLTIERAQKELEIIKNRYIDFGIKLTRELRGKDNRVLMFENGDYWRAFSANDSNRAYRSNISYIDRLISDEIVNVIIRPTTIIAPYNAFNYFEI